MKIWVICSGEAPVSRESRYDPAGYAAYREALLEGEPPAEGVKAARGEGFLLYVSPHAAAQRSVDARWQDQAGWATSAIHNVAKVGWFSSDRTIRQYAEEIWNVM